MKKITTTLGRVYLVYLFYMNSFTKSSQKWYTHLNPMVGFNIKNFFVLYGKQEAVPLFCYLNLFFRAIITFCNGLVFGYNFPLDNKNICVHQKSNFTGQFPPPHSKKIFLHFIFFHWKFVRNK